MRISVLAPAPVPAVRGGAERAWAGIVDAFNELTPHHCDLVTLPSPEGGLGAVATTYGHFLDLDASDADAVISGKYPAWMVEHPVHDVYLFHRLRGLYEVYPRRLPERASVSEPHLAVLLRVLRGPKSRLGARLAVDIVAELAAERPDDPAFSHPGPIGRELVHYLDAVGLEPSPGRRFFTLSETVARRPGSLPPKATSSVIELPSSLPGLRPGSYEHFFTASRLDAPKRLDLLIAAYRWVPGDIPLLIAGTGPQEDALREAAAGDDRVQLLGEISDEELAEHYSKALAVPFVPWEEDWGLIAVEAMASATPVVTCRDSGGVTELIDHGVSGLVANPNPRSIADALTRFVTDAGLAPRLGARGLERSRGITWEKVVEALAPEPVERRRPVPSPVVGWRRGRPKVVVLSTFRVHPAVHGGQLRCWNLYRHLCGDFDVELLCLSTADDRASQTVLAPGLLQTVIARSRKHRELEYGWDKAATTPVGDIVAGLLLEHSPEFDDEARRSLADADVVLLAHPYLLEVAERLAPHLPIVYDAHNSELDLKRELLPEGPAADELLDRVAALERGATERAVVRTACSVEDAQLLADRYGTPLDSYLLIPNGTDVATTGFVGGVERRLAERHLLQRFSTFAPGRAHLCLFIGGWHEPNIDAARRILVLAPTVPDALFVLAGGHSEALRGDHVPANVVAMGSVSERLKLTLLHSASLGLNPMVMGSGTNVKLVEYLAAGLPTLTTPVGARGVPIEHGVHACVAEVEGFGASIRAMLGTDVDHLAAAGRDLVRTSFDWAVLGPRLAEAICSAL